MLKRGLSLLIQEVNNYVSAYPYILLINKIGVWNVRGINFSAKHGPIREMVSKNHFSIVVLLETKVKKENVNFIMSSCGLRMQYYDNYDFSVNWRIWLLWRDDDVSVKLLYSSDQIIHVEVQFKNGGPHFLFTAVYAANDSPPRQSMWNDIIRLSNSINLPWLVAGGFNTMLVYGEKLVDGESVSFDNSELLQYTSLCTLQDMKFTGVFHTWCNNKEGDQRIYYKLDRFLVNDMWLQAFASIETLFERNAISDHACAIISIAPALRPKRSFKFCEMWIKHPDFFDLVQEA